MKPLVSIIINNYNYDLYIRKAIESSLNQTYKPVEILVVDDGSTDSSRNIISDYKSKLHFSFQENQGQNAACNLGFRQSSGDFILFLDSDDFLKPECLDIAMNFLLGTDYIKAQFYLRRVNHLGEPISGFSPTIKMVEADGIVNHMESYGFYPTPPMSGNIYKRAFLEPLFPMPTFYENYGGFYCPIDGLLSGVAGFYPNKIKVINKVLGFYRVHNKNRSDTGTTKTIEKLRRMFMRDWIRENYQNNFALSNNFMLKKDLSRFSPMICKQRLLALRLKKDGHPIQNDKLRNLLICGLIGSCKNPYMSIFKKFYSFFGFVFLAVAPKFLLNIFMQAITKTKPPRFIQKNYF